MQLTARVVGTLFLLIGILEFVPAATANVDHFDASAHNSEAMLLGPFDVSLLHSVVHVMFGAAALLSVGTFARARAYLIGGGLIYLFLWLHESALNRESAVSVNSVNAPDNSLLVGLAATMVALGALYTHVDAVHARPELPSAAEDAPGDLR